MCLYLVAVITCPLMLVFQMYGISLLFGITFVGTFLLSTWTICADSCCLKCCKREILVHELMLEVGDDAVSETIKEKQKEIITRKVKDHIDDGKWEECLDLVEDLIDPINQVIQKPLHHCCDFQL